MKLIHGSFYSETAAEDFRKFCLGSRQGRKDRENAKQASSHALRFCLYMGQGLAPSETRDDLKYLRRVDRIRKFPAHLSEQGYVPSTIKNVLHHLTAFLRHLSSNAELRGSLDDDDIRCMEYELKRLKSDVQRRLLVHRQKVLQAKTDDQLRADDVAAFMGRAREMIPQLFDWLEANGSTETKHGQLMGYIAAYLAFLSGHRAVVLTNITKASLSSCLRWDGGSKIRILVTTNIFYSLQCILIHPQSVVV